ncbi:hypothetical protein FF38_06353 [Lucilia cuprina]|uniref:Uncharacterized protein n=1 Tax=Lucilia cuprina TaxID=7375 RepID=A0A0L0C3G1_LUCCU|nr:hypothetical protein FF38_06353 [Lucilia cuprina]
MVPPESHGLGGGTIILGFEAELVLLTSPISKELAFAAEMLLAAFSPPIGGLRLGNGKSPGNKGFLGLLGNAPSPGVGNKPGVGIKPGRGGNGNCSMDNMLVGKLGKAGRLGSINGCTKLLAMASAPANKRLELPGDLRGEVEAAEEPTEGNIAGEGNFLPVIKLVSTDKSVVEDEDAEGAAFKIVSMRISFLLMDCTSSLVGTAILEAGFVILREAILLSLFKRSCLSSLDFFLCSLRSLAPAIIIICCCKLKSVGCWGFIWLAGSGAIGLSLISSTLITLLLLRAVLLLVSFRGGNRLRPKGGADVFVGWEGPGAGVIVVPEGKFIMGVSFIPGKRMGVGEDDLGVFCLEIFLNIFNLERSGSLESFNSLPSAVSKGLLLLSISSTGGASFARGVLWNLFNKASAKGLFVASGIRGGNMGTKGGGC